MHLFDLPTHKALCECLSRACEVDPVCHEHVMSPSQPRQPGNLTSGHNPQANLDDPLE